MESLASRYEDDAGGEIMIFKKFCPVSGIFVSSLIYVFRVKCIKE